MLLKTSFFFSLTALVLLSSASVTLGAGKPLKFYDANPILTVGAAGDWDGGEISLGAIAQSDDTYYLFYVGRTGSGREPFSIGLATSTDGLAWTKNPTNPLLTSTDIDPARPVEIAYSIEPGDVWVEDGTWIMLLSVYNAYANFAGASIWRATAPAAAGPWTVDPYGPILSAGNSRRWDSNAVYGPSTVKTDSGYMMFYGGANGLDIGMATSTDGLTWVKYDDPTTDQRQVSESDPVFTKTTSGLSNDGIGWPEIVKTADGWGMFYLGFGFKPSVGYATSPDGIIWTPDPNGAIWQAETEVPYIFGHTAVIQKDGQYWIYGRFNENAINLGFWTPAE